MAINANIIGGLQSPVIQAPDPMANYGKALQLKTLLTQNQIQDQTLQDDQSNRAAFAQSGGDPAEYLKALAAGGNYKGYQSAQKMQLDAQVAQANLGKTQAETQKTQSDVVNQEIARHRDQLANVSDPQTAAQWVQAGYQNPVTGKIMQNMMPLEDAVSRIPTDPTLFNQWKQQAALGATKYIEQNKPTYQTSNLGGKTVTTALPGLGGAPTTVNTQMNSQSPDSIASNATARANNAATINKDYTIAGVGPSGKLMPAQESEAQMIAQGKLAPLSGFALARPGGSAIMARVSELAPDFDATTYGAKTKAARDFSTGTQGNAMRSFAVAGQHLDQLNTLVDALDNGNMQIVNKAANAYSAQTGSPAPTNFEAAKDVVGKEVIKAIVGSGGGVAERQELAHQMSQANSPAQLKGVIAQYTSLMGAQHDALLQQRRAAGLSDSTLPNYSTTPAPNAAPPKTGMATPIKTADDYAKLPSGATYIDPNGKTRQKP